MQNEIFKDLDGAALTQALQDTAFITEETLIERTLTTEQQSEYQKRQSLLAERKTEIEDEVKAFMDPLKEEMKSIDEERKAIARTTKKGYVATTEIVYWMQDFDNRMMVAYDGAGKLVKTRRMKQDERQTMMIASSNTVSSKVS